MYPCTNTWWYGFLSGSAMFAAAALAGMIAGMARPRVLPEPEDEPKTV